MDFLVTIDVDNIPKALYPETTEVIETADRLYIQSLHAKGLAWLSKADAGLR